MRQKYDLSDTDCIFTRKVNNPSSSLFATNSRLSRFSSFLSYLLQETATLKRPRLAIALAFFILCSISVSDATDRPDTGTYIRDFNREGYGILTIHNNWTMDTVAVLTDKKISPLLAVYIRANESIEITNIEDGTYGLYFTIGNTWDTEKGTFRSVYGYYRYNQPLLFETSDVGNEIEYSVFELDLYEARFSNFQPDQFQFPDLRS
jgi:hypothetical protein